MTHRWRLHRPINVAQPFGTIQAVLETPVQQDQAQALA
jgi:hypothetical protein